MENGSDTATTGARDRAVALPRGQRLGVWLGINGWLIGLVCVAPDFVPALWRELLIGALLNSALAFVVLAVARRRPPVPEMLAVIIAVCGALLLFYALWVMPVVLALPELVSRLSQLSSVVEVPYWIGAGLSVVGVALWLILRARRSVSARR